MNKELYREYIDELLSAKDHQERFEVNESWSSDGRKLSNLLFELELRSWDIYPFAITAKLERYTKITVK